MPIVIKEIVIKSPPPDAPAEPSLEVELENVLVSSWQTSAASAAGGEIHIESFSWGVSQLGSDASHFDGRFLAARDLTREQASASAEAGGTSRAETTLGDIVVVKQIEKAAPGGYGDDILIAGDGGYDRSGAGKVNFKEFTITKKTDTSLGDEGIDLLLGGAGDDLDAGRVVLDDLNAVRNTFGAVGIADAEPGGVQALFGDGSVRFDSAGVDAGVW